MNLQAAILDRVFQREKLRQGFLDRIHKRRGRVTLPFVLQYRNIFVVPTSFGFGFGMMLVFMALGGLNFNNNMALMLVFVFGVIAQLTTVLAYRNIVGIEIQEIQAEPVFAGERAAFRVFLGNSEVRPRMTINGGFRDLSDCTDVRENASGELLLHHETRTRGWLAMPPFKLETRYPLGMFRAWAWFFPEVQCLVYPAPSRNPPPLPRTGDGAGGPAKKGEGDQVHGIRNYRHGDSLRRVAWRSSARHNTLYTREMETPRDESCELNWDALAGLDVESRLSVLTAWVLMAHRRQIPYSLVLPAHTEPAALGEDHRDRCLRRLALFE